MASTTDTQAESEALQKVCTAPNMYLDPVPAATDFSRLTPHPTLQTLQNYLLVARH